jgi:hypothetical protein
MSTTLNFLMTASFFAPVALLVVSNLLTHRSTGPASPSFVARGATVSPLPPARRAPRVNEDHYLQAA